MKRLLPFAVFVVSLALIPLLASGQAMAPAGSAVPGNQTVGGNSTVTGNLSVTGTTAGTGVAHWTSDGGFGGNLGADGTLVVTGASTLTGAVTASNDAGVLNNLNVGGTLTLPCYPSVIATTNAGQSLSDNTVTIIDFEDEIADTHNAYASGTFTVPACGAGTYSVSSVIRPQNSSAVNWTLVYTSLLINAGAATGRLGTMQRGTLNSTGSAVGLPATEVVLGVGDTLAVQGLQASGGARTLDTSSSNNWINIRRVR